MDAARVVGAMESSRLEPPSWLPSKQVAKGVRRVSLSISFGLLLLVFFVHVSQNDSTSEQRALPTTCSHQPSCHPKAKNTAIDDGPRLRPCHPRPRRDESTAVLVLRQRGRRACTPRCVWLRAVGMMFGHSPFTRCRVWSSRVATAPACCPRLVVEGTITVQSRPGSWTVAWSGAVAIVRGTTPALAGRR